MDFINNITIKSRMVLSFAFVLIFFIVFAVFAIIGMNKLGELTSTLYEHPLKVSNAAQKAKAGVIRMHRSMKDVSMSTTEMELHQAIQIVQAEEKRVYQNLEIIKNRILGKEGKALVNETIDLFAGWKPIRIEVQQLTIQGDREAAGRITREKGADYVFNLERKMMELTAYAINKADGFMEQTNGVQSGVLRNTIISIAAAILLSFLIITLITKSILTSVSRLKNTMSEVTQTGTLIKSKLAGNNEISDMARDFNRLIDRLQGQFWLKDGQTSLNEEMVGELSYEELVTKIINFISRYADACAGAFYSFDEKRSVCKLTASYAFVEGRHFSSEFDLGEGIVGQVALEKKPILLKGITSEEALVKSGTVSEPPRNLYAFPLVYENKLLGILEVATFEEITPLKVEFLEMTAPIISTTLYTALQGEQIQTLLESTQKANEELTAQAKELQAQSEELQQTSEELQQQNVELKQQRLAVEGASRMKSQFLSNMSHELRTPLNSVMALSRVLIMQAKAKLSPEEGNYLQIIERNGKNLLALINDILDLSKIEAGRMDVNPQPFSLPMTLENIVESITPIAAEKQIEIHQDIPKDLPLLESDEIRVSQILQNLIGNGVKFTDTGNVTASVQSDKEKIAVRITDTGIGIAENDLPYIFDEFRQVDGSSSRRHEGTGLGLAIARKAARMLGGDITVTSTPGKGSTFTLTLPIVWQGLAPVYEPIDCRDPSTVKPDLVLKKTDVSSATLLAEIKRILRDLEEDSKNLVVKQSTVPPRILIVDDNETVIIQVKAVLESAGYVGDVARGGQEALDYVSHTIPDGIILDLMMPKIDGLAVLEKIRGTKATAKIPVLILTAKDLTPEDYKKLSANNVQQLVQKGDIDHDSLLYRIRLMVSEKTQTTFETETFTQRPPTHKPVTSQLESTPMRKPGGEKATILVVEDNPDNMITIKAVLQDRYRILEATDGEAGLQMAEEAEPDLILLDMGLPKIDGFTVVRNLKGKTGLRNIPVISMTAQVMKGDREKILAAGCDDYIPKPIDPESAMKKISEWLKG